MRKPCDSCELGAPCSTPDLDRRRKAVGCPNCSKKQAWEKSQSSSSSTVSTGYKTNHSSGGGGLIWGIVKFVVVIILILAVLHATPLWDVLKSFIPFLA